MAFVGGTYSLRLRLRACFGAPSGRDLLGVSECLSAPNISAIPRCLLRDRHSEGPSTWDESLRRKLRLEPLRERSDGVRDNDCELRRGIFHGETPPIGEGKGVISPMAISCGDDSNDAGDREPPPDDGLSRKPRKLDVLRGRLLDEWL